MKKLKKHTNTTKILVMIVLLGLFVVLTSISGVSAASTVYVNATGGSDGNPGTIDLPYQTIGKGISSVEENGTVQLANGNYSGDGNTNLTISRSMTIAGQNQNKTIINGTGTNWIFNISSGVTVTLINLTLTNATASRGGAIYNNGNLTVSNCTFTSNKATISYVYGGGAIYNKGTITSLSGCTFTNNRAAKYGGAVYNDATIISLSGCNFTGNIASSYGGGGAIFNYGTSTVTGSTFTDNLAYNGGAINNQGKLTATNCNFTGNNAPIGGAIDNWDNATVNGCTFTDNTAYSGGAISNDEGTLIAENCTFKGNTATDEGGAIYNYDNLTAHYNRFYNNTAPTGNAIYCYSGSVDANYNWWSSNKDPKTIQNLIYDQGNLVNTTNWVILTINANPTTINNTQNTTITANLNHYTNSTGYVGELSTHIPDGQIKLSIPWGSFTNSGITHTTTLNTVNDAVSAVFYANDGAVPASYNPVKVTALADNYTTNDTESAYITINKASDLYIKTTSSNNNPKVGETFLLTYKLGNYGPDSAEDVTITFQIPEGLDFVNISVDTGNYTYNPTTRTVTWTLDSVPVGDPYLYLTVKAADEGTYKIITNITSITYNLNSGDDGIITINIQPNNNSGNGTNTNTVKAATKTTIGLQKTGLPLNYLILAILMVLSGLVPRRK